MIEQAARLPSSSCLCIGQREHNPRCPMDKQLTVVWELLGGWEVSRNTQMLDLDTKEIEWESMTVRVIRSAKLQSGPDERLEWQVSSR